MGPWRNPQNPRTDVRGELAFGSNAKNPDRVPSSGAVNVSLPRRTVVTCQLTVSEWDDCDWLSTNNSAMSGVSAQLPGHSAAWRFWADTWRLIVG
jgi:hypothetical protein